MPLVKPYYVSYVDYYNKTFRITFQIGNGYVRCAGKSVKLLYINFLHAGMATILLYPEGIDP